MLLAVRISSYGCTWEVWRALKKLELLSAAPRATLTLLSCSPNFPRASITRYTHAKHEPTLNFLSFFVSEKGLAHIYKKINFYFPVSYFCFATSQNCILAELRLPTVIRKVKLTDFVKRATSPKMQLAEFRFHTNSKVHSLL